MFHRPSCPRSSRYSHLVTYQRLGLLPGTTSLAGSDKLTAREAELCASARLLPIHYLSLKDVMMRDAQVHGHISRFDVSVSDCGRASVNEDSSLPGWGVCVRAGFKQD